MVVDAGGFFPEIDANQDKAWFLMDGMKTLGLDAVGLGDRELRFSLAYLKSNLKRTQLPMVCANLQYRTGRKPVVAPYLIKQVGRVTVGVFGLMTDKADLGPSRDTLVVEEPAVAARRTVEELRKKGVTVVVLLSQLGKVESEDLVTAVDGIDAVIVGRNVPMLQKGRLIKATVACYGGEKGQYAGRTVLSLDPKGKVTTGDNEVFVLGPEVGEKPEIAKLVKDFEDAFNAKMQKQQKERAAQNQLNQTPDNNPDHFVGAEICQRCHTAEFDQWKTTMHSHAWQTLVDVKKEATPDCIPCHVVGFRQSGGFQTSADAARLGNVQCENCHGMGTQHEAFPTQPRAITEATCGNCHNATTSPTFNFAVYQPHILHHPPANMPPLPENPNKKKMMETGPGR